MKIDINRTQFTRKKRKKCINPKIPNPTLLRDRHEARSKSRLAQQPRSLNASITSDARSGKSKAKDRPTSAARQTKKRTFYHLQSVSTGSSGGQKGNRMLRMGAARNAHVATKEIAFCRQGQTKPIKRKNQSIWKEPKVRGYILT